jgi:hypothetical protein
MASTGKTSALGLPIYSDGDLASWKDTNTAYGLIDQTLIAISNEIQKINGVLLTKPQGEAKYKTWIPFDTNDSTIEVEFLARSFLDYVDFEMHVTTNGVFNLGQKTFVVPISWLQNQLGSGFLSGANGEAGRLDILEMPTGRNGMFDITASAMDDETATLTFKLTNVINDDWAGHIHFTIGIRRP